jgi:hypothetical protein
MPTKTTTPSFNYFHQRIHKEYQATEADYCTKLGSSLSEDEPFMGGTKPRPYFWQNSDTGSIVMQAFNLDREVYYYPLDTKNEKYKPYQIERLHPDLVNDGFKYKFPSGKGLGTFPFWPVNVVEAFEQQAKSEVLIITEGWLKAWYAGRFGFPVVGLSSITHYRDKDKQGIHQDIAKYLLTIKPKHCIILFDADAPNISTKDLADNKDLRTRPYSFFNAASTIRELLLDYVDNIWFAHILPGLDLRDSLDIPIAAPKGLDDLLLCQPGFEDKILKDLTSFSTTPTYFKRIDISRGTGPIMSHFHLREPKLFYQAHAAIIKDQEFIMNGTHYTFDAEKDELQVRLPAEAKNFAMVGDDYYEFVEIPDMYGFKLQHMVGRAVSTIKTWHGSKLIPHIPKYKAFCNVPSHIEFQPVIHGCYNKYAPFLHEPAEGPYSRTLEFLQHIFGSQIEMGLDYIQLLYQQPALPKNTFMPILCLVSKENNTGKSTFGKFLKAMFNDNATFIGNQDLQENFNAHYITKLVIVCEETFVDKKPQVEKIKALATSTTQPLKDKFKSNQEIDFFGRIIICTNNEDNFIYADKNDTRYWVVKVPVVKKGKGNVQLLAQMEEEIPAFLHFLNNRKLSVQTPQSRFWWTFADIQTEAFRALVDQSRRYIDKDFELMVRECFFDYPEAQAISLTSTTMAARLKCLGKQYHSRDILEHLKRELQHTIKLQHCTNVLELASDGIKYQLSLAPKTARAVTFDRRDYLTDEEIAQLQQNPTTAALPSLNDMQTLLQQTHSSKAVASIFEDYYQVYMLQYSCWVKVQASTGFATAMQPTKFNGLDSVNFCKTSIDPTSMKK